MTEDDARDQVREIVGGEAMDRLGRLVELVLVENQRQNLLARSTVPAIWARHVLDSVQLLRWADPARGLWLDIGTGGGFPGLAIAAVTQGEMMLVEPRRMRAQFLAGAAGSLGLSRCVVLVRRVEAVVAEARTISARAVAPVEKLLQASLHCATADTRWLLLRGRVSPDEQVAWARHTDKMFHVEHSLTDPTSSVLLIDHVSDVR